MTLLLLKARVKRSWLCFVACETKLQRKLTKSLFPVRRNNAHEHNHVQPNDAGSTCTAVFLYNITAFLEILLRVRKHKLAIAGESTKHNQ